MRSLDGEDGRAGGHRGGVGGQMVVVASGWRVWHV